MRSLLSLCVLLTSGCLKPAPPTMYPDNQLLYETVDGWNGQIRHFPGSGPPVLLVHGMGANHYNWDYRPEVSLAHHLRQEGFDVWVPELRGDPGAQPPRPRDRGRFTFDDHATKDLPAIVDAVLAVTGESQVHWVGHSMGGLLLYTALADYPEKIASGVAICSPSTLQSPSRRHQFAAKNAWAVAGNGRIPQRALGRLSAPLGKGNPVVGLIANRDNLDWNVAMGLVRHALVDVPKPMARQALRWVRDREIVAIDGKPWVPTTDPPTVPLYVLGAIDDKIAPEPDVAHACDVFPDCRYTQLSKAHGFSFDYGHIDPVLGSSAKKEVYPLISDFLADQRDNRP